MEFIFNQMSQENALEIANLWMYEGVYAFYNITSDEEDYLEFIDDKRRGNRYFSCFSGNELIGYFTIEIYTDIINLGLGLKPDHTGKNLGADFMRAILNFCKSRYNIHHFTLSVAAFNKRAIKVYEKTGFRAICEYTQKTNGGEFSFIKMENTSMQFAHENFT